MEEKKIIQSAKGKPNNDWIRYLIILVICEKIIQHVAVTLAFYFNWKSIVSTVRVDPTVLMILGASAALLFMLSLWGMIAQKRGVTALLIFLALFDIIGEFVAQGRIDIVINVSFLVAILLLILSLSSRRKQLKTAQNHQIKGL